MAKKKHKKAAAGPLAASPKSKVHQRVHKQHARKNKRHHRKVCGGKAPLAGA